MGFVQIIEFRTSRPDEVVALGEKWMEETQGRNTLVRELVGADRDEPGRYMLIVEFDSYEAAMQNSALPETQKVATTMAELCDGPPSFRNLDVIATH